MCCAASPKVGLKKTAETDAIFEQVAAINQAADADETVLRISCDAKAVVKIGEFSRGGRSRVAVDAADHDFKPEAVLIPFGILLPRWDELFLYFSPGYITADFIVDRLDEWWREAKPRFPLVRMLVINQDNGPEHQSRRTQFLKRIIEFAVTHQLIVRLAYYPPYHSKDNSIERCWGVLEQPWNAALLDEVQTVLNFAQSMTWKGQHPVVRLVETVYQTGVRLTQDAMQALEAQIQRFPKLSKWFVDIIPPALLSLDG